MRNSFISLTRILVASVFLLCITSAERASNTFTEKGLSLLGYHLCNYSTVKNVTKTVVYQKPYEKQTPCGGWIPWRVCTKTFYQEDYHTIVVQEPVNLTDCCDGYEQVGLYCSLPMNRYSEFASRLGACPKKKGEAFNISCTSDMDCPEHKKCCETSKGNSCSDPVLEEQTVTKYWYNVSVLVKMDFSVLSKVDPRLLNHTRLLHSMITGALWPLNISMSVYHIQTTQSEDFTGTSMSQVLVGLQQLVPLDTLSSLLKDIAMKVHEVVKTDVQAACDPVIPNILLRNTCFSNLGRTLTIMSPETLTTTSPENSTTLSPENSTITSTEISTTISPETNTLANSECKSPFIRNFWIVNVTSNSFEASWSVNSMQNYSFRAEVYKGTELIQGIETTDRKLDVPNLEAGVMYTLKVSYEACGKNITSHRIVKTDALIFGLRIRILNYNYTDQFLTTNSTEYQTFSSILMTEIINSFSSSFPELYKSEKVKVQVDSLKAGSVIVRLKIIIEDLQFPKNLSAFDSIIATLNKSSVLVIDPTSTAMEDWDECASRAENDCCRLAECINTVGSYICRCKTTTDANPFRLGRNCEGEIVNPVTTQESNVTEGPVTSALVLSQITAVPSFTSKHTETTGLPSSDVQERSGLPVDNTLSSSQRMITLENVRNNNISAISETANRVPLWWGNITNSTHDQHNSSSTPSSGVSHAVAYSLIKNESVVVGSAPGFTAGRHLENVTALNETQDLKHCALNHTLVRDVGKDNSSWSDEKNCTVLSSCSKENITDPFTTDWRAEKIVFSNVTNASFQIDWTINLTANSDFHVSLFEGKELIKEVKTQSSNLNVSTLKAGTLYTVEIRTEFYGNKSKIVQRKVKTAGQKLNGTVKILNLNYSSAFSNSNSEEYQNFTKLFVSEIRSSLPPNIHQKIDSGLMKILIVSITPGSIVVNFTLLIPVDMDASNVSRSVTEALLNNSHFVIDNSSLSIYDYDECERVETDCSPNASCNNTYGSYECNCTEGYIDVNPERPGRICEVLPFSPDSGDVQTKEWNSSTLSLRYLDTLHMPSSAKENNSSDISLEIATIGTSTTKRSTDLIQKFHHLPQILPFQFNLISVKDAVQVQCKSDRIVVSVRKAFLNQESIPESSLYLGQPECSNRTSNSSHVTLQTAWQCGTEVQNNTTHTIVKTVLRNERPSHGIIRYSKISSKIHCTFRNELLVSSGYIPDGVYTIFEDFHGSGHFPTEMELFVGNSSIPQNFSISASDDVMIEVGIHTQDKTLKVVIGECWATPTNYSMDPQSFSFIRGSCPVPNTHTTIISNGISNRARFRLKIFSFVNTSVVYLHCKMHVCVENRRSTCRMSCQGFRSMRAGTPIASSRASWGPLLNANSKEEKKPSIKVGFIVLIVIAVIVLTLGIAGLLILRNQRKTGTYKVKMKSEHVNYQAFYY